jgi:very-short-patch-repair endonuclease
MYKERYSEETKKHLLKERASRLKRTMTPSERIFEEKLKKLGYDYKPQKGFIARGYFCIVDFYIPRPYRLCIEIDGGYHNTWKQRVKDSDKDYYLTATRKFKVLRLTNEQAEAISLEALRLRIESLKTRHLPA